MKLLHLLALSMLTIRISHRENQNNYKKFHDWTKEIFFWFLQTLCFKGWWQNNKVNLSDCNINSVNNLFCHFFYRDQLIYPEDPGSFYISVYLMNHTCVEFTISEWIHLEIIMYFPSRNYRFSDILLLGTGISIRNQNSSLNNQLFIHID